MAITAEQALEVYRAADCLHDAAAVDAGVDRLAAAITGELRDANPLVVAVLHGGLIPAGLLLPRLDFPLQVDYLHATRYRGETRGGELHWRAHPHVALEGRTVLLVDDIYDEGHTLAAIHRYCVDAGAARVWGAVLVDKRHGRKADYRPEFTGLEVPDRYVFGYGMDYKDYLRNAPGIYAVKEEHV